MKISVVIPVFNAEDYIAATLRSLVKQDYPDLEVVVADGGSTDRTLEIISGFDDRLSLTVVSERDRGQLDALQKGISRAQGDIVYWLNADDICMPGTLKYVADVFARRPDVDIVFSDDFAFNEDVRELYVGATIRGLTQTDHALFYRQMYSECVFWRRSCSRLLDQSNYDLRLYTDYAFFLNQNWGRRLHWVPKRLGAFRVRPGQVSQSQVARRTSEFARIRGEFYRQVGWSETQVARMRMSRRPRFLLTQVAYPAIERGLRRLSRYITGDARRQQMAGEFFDDWLASETPGKAGASDLLFR